MDEKLDPNNIKQVYTEFNHILSGCDTIMDAINFSLIYVDRYPDYRELIHSLVNGRTYSESLDINTKQDLLNDVYRAPTKDDANEILNNISDKLNDYVYKRTLERLVNSKCNRNVEVRVVKKNKNLITKACPHCSFKVTANKNANYVICGYSNGIGNGALNWEGCGKDWCFQCEKLLCKKWDIHGLNLEMNRMHNEECCKKHADRNNKKYEEEYCQCRNRYVDRNVVDILSDIININ